MTKLVMADTRSENAEMDIGRLNVRIDKVLMMVTMIRIFKKGLRRPPLHVYNELIQ